MFRLFGFDPDEPVPSYERVWERVIAEDRDTTRHYTEALLAGNPHPPFTFRLCLPSGEVRSMLQHSLVEFDEAGVPVRATRVISDVTVLQEAQIGLERERQRLQLAQQISHVGSGETNLITGERWWSDETFRLFGMEPSDTPPPFDVARMRVHPDDREISERFTREVLQGNEHAPIMLRLMMPDGLIRHVVMHVHLERTEDGEPLRVTRVVTDITQLHTLQAELERERIRLRYAQEISKVGSGEWNLQTGVTWWSDAMSHLLGFEPGSVEPSRELFLARIHPDDRSLHNAALTRLIAGHQPDSTVLRIALPDGTIRSTLCQLQLEPDEHGAPLLVTGVLSDVTDFLALQEQLGRAKRLEAVGTLTAGIAHDFNNLLTVIGGSVELATMGDMKRLEQAELAVQRATALVRQLLQFSRTGADGVRDESVTLVDLRAVAQEAADALTGDAIGTVAVDLPRQAVIATVDPTRVHRVLMNLLVNARDAVQEALGVASDDFTPQVAVKLRITEPTPLRTAGADIEVSDNGPGMSSVVRDRVFEPFFTTKPPGRGTGLGLATVYGVMRDMHGTVDVTSQPGQGTTFRLWLPLTPPAHPAVQGEDHAPHDHRILILDDESDLLDYASTVLERGAFEVVTARTSEGVVARLKERPFDLVILDAFVDAVPVTETLARIRQLQPSQRVMLWSGSAGRAQAIAWGADEFLAKPFNSDALLRTVRGILGIPVPSTPPAGDAPPETAEATPGG